MMKSLTTTHFKSHGFPVETNQITKNNQIWVYDRNGNKRKDCWQFDRFTLKIDWDDFNKRPQLVLSYDRPTLVYRKSIAQLLEQQGDPFDADAPEGFTLSLVKRAYFTYRREDGRDAYIIGKYEYLANRNNFNVKSAYPIMWPPLADYVGIPEEDEDSEDPMNIKKPTNKNHHDHLLPLHQPSTPPSYAGLGLRRLVRRLPGHRHLRS